MPCGVALGIGDRDRQNLTFEGASRSRGCGFAVAGERILVHVFAGEPIFVCNHLSALKLTELGDAVACVHAGRHRVAKACLECQAGRAERSEEHTSELQSLMRISYAVFCLKKKKKHNQATTTRPLIVLTPCCKHYNKQQLIDYT